MPLKDVSKEEQSNLYLSGCRSRESSKLTETDKRMFYFNVDNIMPRIKTLMILHSEYGGQATSQLLQPCQRRHHEEWCSKGKRLRTNSRSQSRCSKSKCHKQTSSLANSCKVIHMFWYSGMKKYLTLGFNVHISMFKSALTRSLKILCTVVKGRVSQKNTAFIL